MNGCLSPSGGPARRNFVQARGEINVTIYNQVLGGGKTRVYNLFKTSTVFR